MLGMSIPFPVNYINTKYSSDFIIEIIAKGSSIDGLINNIMANFQKRYNELFENEGIIHSINTLDSRANVLRYHINIGSADYLNVLRGLFIILIKNNESENLLIDHINIEFI
jgi:hypothetical protein